MIRKKYILVYIIGLLSLFLLFGYSTVLYKSYIYKNSNQKEKRLLDAIGKYEHLKENYKKYDLVFLGSSKAYIGIDVKEIENQLNVPAFNYASMAHWFPTQYVQFKRLVPFLKNKTVVWTISHEMFEGESDRHQDIQIDDVNKNFYLDIYDYFEYMEIGFDNSDIFDNLLLRYLDSNFILFVRDSIQTKFRGVLNKPIVKQEIVINKMQIDQKEVSNYLKLYPDYFDYRILDAANTKNAMLYIYRKSGHLACIELKPKYLREQQILTGKGKVIKIDERKEKLFFKILQLFKKHNINLIVNNYWDAPYTYSESSKENYEKYLYKIEKIVLKHNFKFINSSIQLKDENFFDGSHLNSIGSKKYSKYLAKEILDAI